MTFRLDLDHENQWGVETESTSADDDVPMSFGLFDSPLHASSFPPAVPMEEETSEQEFDPPAAGFIPLRISDHAFDVPNLEDLLLQADKEKAEIEKEKKSITLPATNVILEKAQEPQPFTKELPEQFLKMDRDKEKLGSSSKVAFFSQKVFEAKTPDEALHRQKVLNFKIKKVEAKEKGIQLGGLFHEAAKKHKVQYEVRSRFAKKRPRIGGRFVAKETYSKLRP